MVQRHKLMEESTIVWREAQEIVLDLGIEI